MHYTIKIQAYYNIHARGSNPLKASCAKYTVLVCAYEKRFSTAFQLITSQMALKYSALRFWYWRLD